MADEGRTQKADETAVSSPGSLAAVRLRYWAAAKAAAGTAEETFSGATVADVLRAATDAHADDVRFARVLGMSSLLLDERPLGTSELSAVRVTAGQVIEVLPPFAGG